MGNYYFVHQRVKLARPFFPTNEAKEGTLVSLFPSITKLLFNRYNQAQVIEATINCAVRFDDDPSSDSGQHTSQLEPLLKDDNESLEEELVLLDLNDKGVKTPCLLTWER